MDNSLSVIVRRGYWRYNESMSKLQNKITIEWSEDFAYAIGLIASDGSVHKDGKKIWFSSKDQKLIEKFKKALNLSNTIGRYARGGEKEKTSYFISSGDKNFVIFLRSIGITSAKSKTIQAVKVPNTLFRDFLRGLFDGDGCFYTFQDRRWPNSFGYQLSWASASKEFILWLKEELAERYDVRGFIKLGKGVYTLNYVKGDTRKLFDVMYGKKPALFLSRKYSKILSAFERDEKFGKLFLQKQRMPR